MITPHLPVRLPRLLNAAVESGWYVTINQEAGLLDVSMSREETALNIVWERREDGPYRLALCELLGQPDPKSPGFRLPATPVPLRDVLAILWEAS